MKFDINSNGKYVVKDGFSNIVMVLYNLYLQFNIKKNKWIKNRKNFLLYVICDINNKI